MVPSTHHHHHYEAPKSTTMEQHVDTSIASHLLAAINVLPPLQEYNNGEPQARDRPPPLEPTAIQESYNSVQYVQRRPDATTGSPHDKPAETQGENGDSVRMDAAQPEQSDKMDVDPPQNGVAHNQQTSTMDHDHVEQPETTPAATHAYPAILPSGPPATPGQKAPTAVMQSSVMPAPLLQTPQNKNTSRTTQTPNSTASRTNSNRRMRRKWTEEETNDLIKGCHIVCPHSTFQPVIYS